MKPKAQSTKGISDTGNHYSNAFYESTYTDATKKKFIEALEGLGSSHAPVAHDFKAWVTEYYELKTPYEEEAEAFTGSNTRFVKETNPGLFNMKEHCNKLARCLHKKACWDKFKDFANKAWAEYHDPKDAL